MEFAEDYRCRSQEEIQSAYWSQTQVTIHPLAAYYKQGDKLVHQSYVFVSDESCHDAKFVFALLLELAPCLKFVYYRADSPTTHYRTRQYSKSYHFIKNILMFGVVELHVHGKGLCDPIGRTTKKKANLAVKNDKAVVQDAHDFFAWAKESEETSTIRFRFLYSEDCANAALFLSEACKDIKPVQGTMKLHPVLLHAANKIWVRDTSCFGDCCFNGSFQQDTSCEG